MKKLLAWLLAGAMAVSLFAGCGKSSGYQAKQELADSGDVTLTLVGMTPAFKAMESVIASFSRVYPNCTVEYEYLQDYQDNLPKRLKSNTDVDLFLTKNITADSPLLPYALELSAHSDALDLSGTYEGLIRNFTVTGSTGAQLYAVPMGGELRGMYVNRTLLRTQGLSVPENYAQLLDCCAALKKAGYVPLQGNPGSFSQLLMYPYICGLVAGAKDYQTLYDRVDACEPGISEVFREPMARLYELVKNGYYNYKYVETTEQTFLDGRDDTAAMNFLNIVSTDGADPVKRDDVGQVAFMPGTMSLKSTLDKLKSDYHSEIDYTFILSPVSDGGGYAYLSPATGIAVNRNSAHTEWALEFLNYLFTPEVNRAFAEEQNIIPNTAQALDVITDTFHVDDAHVCQLGQVTFRYVFYDVVHQPLIDVSKANNPKYMQPDGTMYDLEYYMAELESAFAAQRT